MPSKLVKMIRTKYPGEYDDIPDDELERLITTKYPGEYDDLLVPDETIIPQQPERSLLSRGWEALTTPLSTWPTDIARSNRQYFDEAASRGPEFLAPLMRGMGGINEAIGDFASGFYSPLDIGLTATTAGSGALARKGISTGARALEWANKALSGAVTAHGAGNVVSPESSLGERAFGLLEVLGGGAGLLPRKINPAVIPDNTDPLAGIIEPTSVTEPRFRVQPETSYRPGASQPIASESILTDSAGNPIKTKLKTPTRNRFKLEKDGTYTDPKTGENFTEQQMLWKELEELAAQEGITPAEYQLRNSGGTPIKRISPYETKTVPLTPEELIVNADKTISPYGTPDVKFNVKGEQVSGPPIPPEEINYLKETLAFPRAVMASIDLPPMRQGLPLITTKAWWTAWGDMAKAYGSKGAFDIAEKTIKSDSLYEISERAGIKFTDLLNKSEESYASKWAKIVPLVARSHRAHTAYLNKLRFDTFKRMYNQAVAANKGTELDPSMNDEVLRKIGDFINDATGRGSLDFSRKGKFKSLDLEKSADTLNNIFFSPRLMTSRVRMWNRYFNPYTYRMMTPEIRKETLRSLVGTLGTWFGIGYLAKSAGAEVSLDPTNTDFGKIKIGDFRMDPAGGFQQYLVAAARGVSGLRTSSTSGKTVETGQGYGTPTREDILLDFGKNKLNPPIKFIADMLSASTGRPVNLTDQALSMVLPIMVQDLIQMYEEDPKLFALLPFAMSGMGIQSYGERGEGKLVPKKYDYKFTGGSVFK